MGIDLKNIDFAEQKTLEEWKMISSELDDIIHAMDRQLYMASCDREMGSYVDGVWFLKTSTSRKLYKKTRHKVLNKINKLYEKVNKDDKSLFITLAHRMLSEETISEIWAMVEEEKEKLELITQR